VARPLVGITCYVEPARWGVWDCRASVLQQAYVDAVATAGGRSLILPPDDVDDQVLDVLDALVVTGGADIDPARYGAARHPTTDPARTDRDAGELLLVRGALARDLPLLGICRGAQMMAIAAGGTLIQDLPELLGHSGHRETLGTYSSHNARLAPGSRLVEVLGGSDVKVNAHHHQAVSDPGSLTACAWADDGTIEAVEDASLRFALGVQWHPEFLEDQRLFTALVASARDA
jgi:putative glutamine amidotransferase